MVTGTKTEAHWRIRCTDGEIRGASGPFDTLDEAVKTAEQFDSPPVLDCGPHTIVLVQETTTIVDGDPVSPGTLRVTNANGDSIVLVPRGDDAWTVALSPTMAVTVSAAGLSSFLALDVQPAPGDRPQS